MTTSSWWVGLSREQFATVRTYEAERMAMDKKAKLYQTDAFERKEPPRRTVKTPYTYHLELEPFEL